MFQYYFDISILKYFTFCFHTKQNTHLHGKNRKFDLNNNIVDCPDYQANSVLGLNLKNILT